MIWNGITRFSVLILFVLLILLQNKGQFPIFLKKIGFSNYDNMLEIRKLYNMRSRIANFSSHIFFQSSQAIQYFSAIFLQIYRNSEPL